MRDEQPRNRKIDLLTVGEKHSFRHDQISDPPPPLLEWRYGFIDQKKIVFFVCHIRFLFNSLLRYPLGDSKILLICRTSCFGPFGERSLHFMLVPRSLPFRIVRGTVPTFCKTFIRSRETHTGSSFGHNQRAHRSNTLLCGQL